MVIKVKLKIKQPSFSLAKERVIERSDDRVSKRALKKIKQIIPHCLK